ncbi:MAG: hypothetical protein SFX72_09525 [Isosphaeraceae bacterium]|nr:hypothetical protein [Isosphaeraceae bacterium]
MAASVALQPVSIPINHRREAGIALAVVLLITLGAAAGIRHVGLAAPALVFPLTAFALAGHVPGRRLTMTCIVSGFAALLLGWSGPVGAFEVDAFVPGVLGGVTWIAASLLDRSAAKRERRDAEPADWMEIEIDLQFDADSRPTALARIPVKKGRESARDLHVMIVRRRREVALARRA